MYMDAVPFQLGYLIKRVQCACGCFPPPPPLSSLIHNYAHFILLLLLCFLMQFFLSNHIDPNLLSASNATPLHGTANPGIMQVAKYRLYHKVEVAALGSVNHVETDTQSALARKE